MNSYLTYNVMNERHADLRRQAAEARTARAARPTRSPRRFKLSVLGFSRRLPKPVGEPITNC